MNIEHTEFERECEQMRKRVFSAIAHDVKTPLACIIGALQTLEMMREKLSPQQHDMLLQTALTEAQRLDVLFSTLLEKAAP